jgi:hypothetical protein
MTEPVPVIEVDCVCNGLNPTCIKCDGTAKVKKVGCVRCNGTGFNAGMKAAGKCVDCKGFGWRELDNPTLW